MSNVTETDAAPAVISGDRILTHGDLRDSARRAATVLKNTGVGEGDVIALHAYNAFGFFVFSEAVRYLGANVTPVNWHLTPPEVAYIVDDCNAKAVIMHASFATPAMREAVAARPLFVEPVADELIDAYRLEPGFAAPESGDRALSLLLLEAEPIKADPAPPAPALFYTSGTTGKPKAVKRRPVPETIQEAVGARSAYAFGLDGGENIIAVMTGPLYHSAPNAYGMLTVRSGGMLILQPRFDAKQLLAFIERYQVTHLHMVPTMFQRLLALSDAERMAHDLSSLQHVVHGAAPCPTDVKASMIAWWGPIIHEYYAMTELGIVACSNSAEWSTHRGSVGRPAPGVEIAIQNEDGTTLASGGNGEICVRHEATDAFEYHGDPEKTRASRRNGYVVTGDVGYLDADGFLYINDRKSDMIISGGVNIYPAEIESALAELAEVEDAVVFGVPHPEFGETVAAVIVRRVEVDADALRDKLRKRIAGFKVPRIYQFVDALPREDSGKIKKRVVKQAFLANAAQANA